MEKLLKEMQDYRKSLVRRSKTILKRILDISSSAQDNEHSREYMNRLTSDHENVNLSIALLDYKIERLERDLEKEKV